MPKPKNFNPFDSETLSTTAALVIKDYMDERDVTIMKLHKAYINAIPEDSPQEIEHIHTQHLLMLTTCLHIMERMGKQIYRYRQLGELTIQVLTQEETQDDTTK